MSVRTQTYGSKDNPSIEALLSTLVSLDYFPMVTVELPQQSTTVRGPLRRTATQQIGGIPLYTLIIGGDKATNEILLDEATDYDATVTVEFKTPRIPETNGTLIYITAVENPWDPNIPPNTPFMRFYDSEGRIIWKDITGKGFMFNPKAILDFEVIELPKQKG